MPDTYTTGSGLATATTTARPPVTEVGPVPGFPVHVELAYWPEGSDVSRWDIALWGTDLWAGSPPFADVSCDVISFRSQAGRDVPLERFRPATATVELHDPAGLYTPWRTAADPSMYTTIRPGIAVRVWVDTPAGPIDRFYGLVDSITDTWAVPGDETSHRVVFQCHDVLSVLAAYDGVEQPEAGDGELAGARLGRIASNAQYTYPTVFDAGTVALQGTTLAKNAADEMGLVCDTEFGALWADRSGVLQFRDRNGLVADPDYTHVQAVFGEVEPEICYSDIQLASDLDKIKNVVGIANVGGTMVTHSDLTSISLYQPRTYRRTDLIHDDPAQSAIIADRHLDFFAYAASRIEGLAVDLIVLNDTQRVAVLALDLLHRIEVRRRAEGFQVVTELQIQRVAEDITPNGWRITFGTFSADAIFDVARWDIALWDTGLWGY